jgi:hypothetical protein
LVLNERHGILNLKQDSYLKGRVDQYVDENSYPHDTFFHAFTNLRLFFIIRYDRDRSGTLDLKEFHAFFKDFKKQLVLFAEELFQSPTMQKNGGFGPYFPPPSRYVQRRASNMQPFQRVDTHLVFIVRRDTNPAAGTTWGLDDRVRSLA